MLQSSLIHVMLKETGMWSVSLKSLGGCFYLPGKILEKAESHYSESVLEDFSISKWHIVLTLVLISENGIMHCLNVCLVACPSQAHSYMCESWTGPTTWSTFWIETAEYLTAAYLVIGFFSDVYGLLDCIYINVDLWSCLSTAQIFALNKGDLTSRASFLGVAHRHKF